MSQIDGASLCLYLLDRTELVPSVDRIQSPKRHVLNKRQDDG
jgi:hypothetical protein